MTPVPIRRAHDVRDARRNVRRALLVQPKDMEPIVGIAKFFGLFAQPPEIEAIQSALDCLESAHYGLVPVYTAALVKGYGLKWKKFKDLSDRLAAEKLALVEEEDHATFYPAEPEEEEDE